MTELNIPTDILANWQKMANSLAALIDVPAALVMRLVKADIEVFVASQTDPNPYHPGEHETLENSGLYCETVVRTRRELMVPNALSDPAWCDNPDIKLNMISYLGLPILLPDGTPFGTLCVLDQQEHLYSQTQRDLLAHFRDLLESQLGLLQMNHELGEESRSLHDYIDELKLLRQLIPICSYCKSIRTDAGDYEPVEAYMHRHSDAEFTHTICPTCMEQHHPDVYAK